MPFPEIPLAIVAAGFGGLVGSILSSVLRAVQNHQKTKESRTTLRQSLMSEISILQIFDKNPQTAPSFSYASTVVFESNAGEIGLLSQGERLALITFYGSLSWYTALDDPDLDDFNEVKRHRNLAITKLEEYIEEGQYVNEN